MVTTFATGDQRMPAWNHQEADIAKKPSITDRGESLFFL
jgi:hypothetical protein